MKEDRCVDLVSGRELPGDYWLLLRVGSHRHCDTHIRVWKLVFLNAIIMPCARETLSLNWLDGTQDRNWNFDAGRINRMQPGIWTERQVTLSNVTCLRSESKTKVIHSHSIKNCSFTQTEASILIDFIMHQALLLTQEFRLFRLTDRKKNSTLCLWWLDVHVLWLWQGLERTDWDSSPGAWLSC